MGLADFLAGLDLSPEHRARLATLGGVEPASMIPTDPVRDAGEIDAPSPAAPPLAAKQFSWNAPGYENVHSPPFSATGPMQAPTPQYSGAPAGADGKLDAAEVVAGTPDVDRKTAEQLRSAVAARGAAGGAPAADGDGDGAPAASPGRFVPAHWQHGTRSEAVRYGMDPEHLAPARSAYDAAQGHGTEAGELRLRAAQEEGAADAMYAASHAKASQDAALQMQRLQDQKNAYIGREQEKLAQLSEAATQKVDMDAAQGGTGGQIVGAIAIALGQFGASLTGGPNAALQIVQNNIDRRVRAQETNIANAGKAHDREQSLYHQNLEAFGDRERAVLATKMQYLDQVKAMSDVQYAQAGFTKNEAAKHAWDAELGKGRGALEQNLAKLTEDVYETNENEHYVPGQMVGGTPVGKKLENLVTLPDGTTVQAENKEQYNAIVAHARVVGSLQRMNNQALVLKKELYELHPLSPIPSSQERISAIKKQLEDMEIEKTSLLSSKDGEGVQRDSEFARNSAKRGFYLEGTDWYRSGVLSPAQQRAADDAIRAQNARGSKELEEFAITGGAQVVKRKAARDNAGNVAPGAVYTGQTASEPQHLAPHGAVPLKPGTKVPTADKSLSTRVPYDPRTDYVPTPSGGIARRKK